MIRELLFTRNCAVCGRVLLDGDGAERGVCAACAGQFLPDPAERCARCGRHLISEAGLCISCKKDTPPFFDAAIPLYPYTGRYRALLQAYKFGAHTALAVFFAEKLLEARALLPPEAAGAVWTPVPPRPGKIKKDGWDQIAHIERVLRARYGKKEGITVRRTLKRLPSRSQKELDRESRRVNLSGKIIVTEPRAVRDAKNIILFDDVLTTGSTLSACAEALKSAGAQNVWGLCLFYD